mmetsp:Transcript_3079/g.9141  ORF Transcript_3079/g.9141 Transcript_3079/m.9141 type:complete len:369 (+) Transcript_3079:600-1706(+)
MPADNAALVPVLNRFLRNIAQPLGRLVPILIAMEIKIEVALLCQREYTVEKFVAIPIAGRPVVRRTPAFLRTAHRRPEQPAIPRHRIRQPHRRLFVPKKAQRHQRHPLYFHPALPTVPNLGECRPRQLNVLCRHVDQVRAQGRRAVRVRALQAELHSLLHIRRRPECRIRRRRTVRPGQGPERVGRPLSRVALVDVRVQVDKRRQRKRLLTVHPPWKQGRKQSCEKRGYDGSKRRPGPPARAHPSRCPLDRHNAPLADVHVHQHGSLVPLCRQRRRGRRCRLELLPVGLLPVSFQAAGGDGDVAEHVFGFARSHSPDASLHTPHTQSRATHGASETSQRTGQKTRRWCSGMIGRSPTQVPRSTDQRTR